MNQHKTSSYIHHAYRPKLRQKVHNISGANSQTSSGGGMMQSASSGMSSSANPIIKITDYAGSFQYEDSDGAGSQVEKQLIQFQHSKGRCVWTTDGFAYQYNLTDHLGNVRVVFGDGDRDGRVNPDPITGVDVVQVIQGYYPFGMRHGGDLSTVAPPENQYLYNGKEMQDELGLGWYDYGARMYDPSIGRWNGVDALAEERSSVTPWQYVQNNPILRIDSDGNLDSPIYDVNGEFIGTDENGLQGEAIVMSSAYFEQGMTNEKALEMGYKISEVRKQEGLGPMSNETIKKIDNHVEGLSNRPDWDGVVTIDEGIAWAKEHPNLTKENVTASDALYLNVAEMDFGNLGIEEFNTIGVEQAVNLLDHVNMFSNRSRFTTYALGRTSMTLLDNDGTVSVSNGEFKVPGRDFNDYDWNTGGGRTRSSLIIGERMIKGLDDSHGFPLKVYGTGTLNQEK